jgi:hypothetical protein
VDIREAGVFSGHMERGNVFFAEGMVNNIVKIIK